MIGRAPSRSPLSSAHAESDGAQSVTFRLNRRSFVATATAGAAALIAAAGLKHAQAGVDADTLAGLTATRMLELAPDAFTVATEPGERVTTTLIEVHSASSTPEAGRRAFPSTAFSASR